MRLLYRALRCRLRLARGSVQRSYMLKMMYQTGTKLNKTTISTIVGFMLSPPRVGNMPSQCLDIDNLRRSGQTPTLRRCGLYQSLFPIY